MGQIRVSKLVFRLLQVFNAILNACEKTAFQRLCQTSANRVQIDILQACENRSVVEQYLGFEAAFPETTGALVFPVRIVLTRTA
jgi:hypothetical protein